MFFGDKSLRLEEVRLKVGPLRTKEQWTESTNNNKKTQQLVFGLFFEKSDEGTFPGWKRP